MAVGDRSSCVGLNLGFELLDHSVALASRIFQVLPVQDSYRSPSVLDKSRPLQDRSRNTDDGPSGPKHARQKFVGKGQNLGANSVLAHQQPACQALLSFVKPIAGGNLRQSQ